LRGSGGGWLRRRLAEGLGDGQVVLVFAPGEDLAVTGVAGGARPWKRRGRPGAAKRTVIGLLAGTGTDIRVAESVEALRDGIRTLLAVIFSRLSR